MHWGDDNSQDSASATGDFTQWHTFAVEWTPDHIIGYLDGVEFYRTEDKDANPPGPMHFAMQQDIGPYGTTGSRRRTRARRPRCTFEVDWVRIYAA